MFMKVLLKQENLSLGTAHILNPNHERGHTLCTSTNVIVQVYASLRSKRRAFVASSLILNQGKSKLKETEGKLGWCSQKNPSI